MSDFLTAFNRGERAVAELIGASKAGEIFARQYAIADCRRRAASLYQDTPTARPAAAPPRTDDDAS